MVWFKKEDGVSGLREGDMVNVRDTFYGWGICIARLISIRNKKHCYILKKKGGDVGQFRPDEIIGKAAICIDNAIKC